MADNKNQGLVKRLQNFFGWNSQATKSSPMKSIDPVQQGVEETKRRVVTKDFPPRIKELWDWYLNETADTSQTMSDRNSRYKDIDYMIYNDSIISMALNLYADEISQPDDSMEIIKVTAPDSAVAKEIRKLLEKWEINQKYIREVSYNLCAYGDSFDIVDIDPKEGVKSLTPIDVYDVTDRLEFKASEIKKRRDYTRWYNICRDETVRQYISDFNDEIKDSPSVAFDSYLFGFIICEEYYLAPWQVLHYRLESRRSEFWPWGRPLFINLVGPWRQLKTSMNLLALARTMKFPKDIFSVDTSEEMTAMEKWDAVNTAREEYSNMGRRNKAKEEFALADEIWVPKDLIDFQTHQTDISLDDIADVELLRDNIMMGTAIPKGYLITDEGGWGTSSQSLLQQSKPFGRAVYRIQSEELERISSLIRLHFLITEQFNKEFTEFQLSMNFPIVEEASDRLQLKSDTLDLANSVINNLKDAMGYTAEKVPISLIKKVFAKYSFLSPEEIDKYISELEKEQKKADAEGETFDANDVMSNGGFQGDREVDFGESIRKFESRLSEDVVRTAYFESLKDLGISESTINYRHIKVSRSNLIPKQEAQTYRMLRETSNSRERISG